MQVCLIKLCVYVKYKIIFDYVHRNPMKFISRKKTNCITLIEITLTTGYIIKHEQS